ncbi:hypothetical protein SCLCIDRAFT_142057 [Scleroderma citrinum Foug A]|uniref:Uncharacterized protein n=1 Tax=Scleroderma citrinum Foug A TaxID=1036808 RepID=A0A0C2ZGU8_9AGAM|nr:hypothetical protein SCLCIDRAFT_142057 [Scleroderma citrinum Foug A]
MTAAYAFTDYRSQGQMIPYVFVDIATPPTRGLNLFNLYKLFQTTHRPELIVEDDRLAELDAETKKQWKAMGRGRDKG